MKKRITAEWLQGKGASGKQMTRFQELYPDGMDITEANAKICRENGLDVVWAACYLMTEVQIRTFLAQRQPYVIKLFRAARLDDEAQAIAGLNMQTDPFGHIQEVMDAVQVVAQSAAWATQNAQSAAWAIAQDAQDTRAAQAVWTIKCMVQ